MCPSPSNVALPNKVSDDGVPNRIRGREGNPPIAGYPWAVPHAVKRCAKCGASYRRPEWVALRYVGMQLDLAGGPQLELRNCPCGTTLSVEVSTPREVWSPDAGGKLRPCVGCGVLRIGDAPGLCVACAAVRP